MKIIAFDIGHNCPPDVGAKGLDRNEGELNLELGKKIISLLKPFYNVIECLPESANSINESLTFRANTANLARAGHFISLHHNAFDKQQYGCEVYHFSKAGQLLAENILKEICKTGYVNRGVKTANYYVLRYTNMPAVLIETCFCDSKSDMAKWNSDVLAKAIATGIKNAIN